MENAEIIQKFLAGELSKEAESDFLKRLAGDADLQRELRVQRNLEQAFQDDADSVYVPAEATEKVFANLGFAIPSNKKRPLFPFLHTTSFRVAASITAFLLSTYAAGELFFDSSDRSSTETTNEQVQTKEISNYPMASSVEISKNAAKSKTSTSGNFTKFSALNPQNTIFDTETKEESYSDLSKAELTAEVAAAQNENIEISSAYRLNSSRYPGRNKAELSNYSMKNLSNFAFNMPDFDQFGNSHFEITWSKSGSSNLNKLSVPNDDYDFFHNCNFSILYKLTDEHFVGVEFGEENFSQEFTYNTLGQNALYEQQPNYYFYGVSYKYSPEFLRIGSNIQPFGKLSAGGTKGGPVAKAQCGVNIGITPSIHCFLAGEYGGILYNTTDKIYFGDKSRILWGFSLNM